MINKEKFFSIVAVTVLGCLMAVYANAQDLELTPQEKQRYDANPKLILPAANKAFDESDYLQVQKLCRFHWIVLGDDAAESEANKSLWDKAKSCMALTEEMQSLISVGKVAEAKEKAEQLLKLNLDDKLAREVSQMIIIPSEPETKPEPEPEPSQEPKLEPQPESTSQVAEVQLSAPVAIEQMDPVASEKSRFNPRTRFGVRAGVAFCDLSKLDGCISPELAIALYDIGGSRIGFEISAIAPPSSKLDLGVDVSVAVRLVNKLYARAGLGGFRCDSGTMRGAARGTYAGLGFTYIIGNHFIVSAGARVFPEVCIYEDSIRQADTVSYNLLVKENVLKGGLGPSLTIGWAF